MADPAMDKELNLYRGLLETPKEFKEGFGWTTIAGIFFCGLVMLPGSIYLGLMSGSGVNQAAAWVTLILFSEVARRALKSMDKQHLVVLLNAAQMIMAANVLFPGGPVSQMVFRAFLTNSDAMRDSGMSEYMPWWFVPEGDSEGVLGRNLLHPVWLFPLGLLLFTILIGTIKNYSLGYFFFRLTSDVEKLPFPMAPIMAQGAMALAEHDDEQNSSDGDPAKTFFSKEGRTEKKKKSSKWRIFSLGAVLGIAFGFFQVGIPAITGVLLDQRVFPIPQPFIDTTTLTEGFLPATPTGMAIDMGMLLIGMVLPFWAVMGTFFALVMTLIANPILHEFGMLTNWQPGMDTVNTTFANEKDFWMSFTIGVSVGLLAVSLYQSIRDVRRKMKTLREENENRVKEDRVDLWAPPTKGRGDFPVWMALGLYALCGTATIAVSVWLLSTSQFITGTALFIMAMFMVMFVFVYTPLISYLNARLLGIAGQTVDIPYMREVAFILSGAKGIEIWTVPVPIENYGASAQNFRVMELTGTTFWSSLKTQAVAIPTLFVLSFTFWAFIWSGNEIPGAGFPYADVYWELESKRIALQWSATFVTEGGIDTYDFWQTEFGQAIKPPIIGAGAGATIVGFGVMSFFGLPIMFIYGVIKGLGQFPHIFVFEIIGAFIGRFYFQKKFGKENFLRMVPTLLAGYFTGVGLIGMATVALDLIKKAVSGSPF